MKKQYYLFTLVISTVLIFSSCKDDEGVVPEETTNIQCFKSKTEVYNDGLYTGYTVYTEIDEEKMSYELTYDDNDILSDSGSHTYNSDNQKVRSYYFNRTNNFTQVQTWQYNEIKKIKRYELRIQGNVSRVENHTYNKNGDIDTIFVQANGVSSMQVAEYADGQLSRVKTLDQDGNITQTNNYTYSGNTIIIERRNADNELQSTTTIVKNDKDQEISWTLKDKSGNKTIKRVTEYDQNGYIISVKDDFGSFGTYEYKSTWKCQ